MDSHLGVCIYYVLIHCVIYYPVQGKYYSLGNLLDFNSAFKRCQNNGSYLPHVDLRSRIFLLKDFESEGNCFWVQAILKFATDNLRNEFPYPEFCCGTLQKDGETLTQSCISCSNTASYICMSDLNVYKSGSNINASTWVDARDDCKHKGDLPLANNTNLQSKLVDWKNENKSFWIAKIGWFRPFFTQDEEYECGYWCKNEVTFGSCFQEGRNLTTYCVSASSNASSGTTAANVPTRRTPERAIWPILGGAVGAFVAFIVVVIIIIIIFVRRRRMKKDQDAVLKSSTTNSSPDKVLSQNNLSYDTINGESFTMEEPIAKESVIYAQPQKVSKQSRNVGQATDDQEKHGLYSKVQKEHNTHGISSNLMESGNGESSENVYNKANFHQEETANMYDKADFRLEVLKIGTINDYDKATFHRLENSNYDTGYIANATADSTYDRLN